MVCLRFAHILFDVGSSSTRILDTLSLAMIAHGLYIYLISDYMDPLALAYMSW